MALQIKSGVHGSGLRREGRCLHYQVNLENRLVLDCMEDALLGRAHCRRHHRHNSGTRAGIEAFISEYELNYRRRAANSIGVEELIRASGNIIRRYRELVASGSSSPVLERIVGWLDEANDIESELNNDIAEIADSDDEDFLTYDDVILFSDEE